MTSTTGAPVALRESTGMQPGIGRDMLVLFALALLLYLPGIVWGLPHATAADRVAAWGSDETAPLGPLAQVLHYVLHRPTQLDPRYPLLAYVVQAIFMAPYLLVLRLTGGLSAMNSTYPFGLVDPVGSLATLTVLARLPSTLMAAALPAIAYRTALTLWNRRTAITAGLFVLVLYPLFFYSRTSNVDGHALFWTALGLMVFASYLRHGLTDRRAILLGLFAALATASKDQSYALFAMLYLAIGVRALLRTGSDRDGRPWRGLAVAVAAGAVAYPLASGLAANPRAFLGHVDFIMHGSGGAASHFYFSNAATLTGYLTVLSEFVGHTVATLGVPMALAALFGMVVMMWSDRTALLLLLPVVGLLIGVILPVRFVLLRFVLPASYLLAVVAARAFGGTRPHGTPDGNHATATARFSMAAIAVIVGWSLVRGADLTVQMLRDSRYEAAAWLDRNTIDGDTIGYYGAAAKLPALPEGVVTRPGPYESGDGKEPPPAMPQFILFVPQQPFEQDHEWTLPEERYAELIGGRAGYRLMLATRSPALFPDQPITWVNPPVRILVRDDVVPRLVDTDVIRTLE